MRQLLSYARLTFVAATVAGLIFPAVAFCQESDALIEPVSDADILDPPASDWLMFRGNLANWGYSPLDEIDRDNVHQLDFAWSFTMEKGPIETTPLVRDGVLFLPSPGDVIHAIDAETGDLIWEYRREWPEDFTGGGLGMRIASIVRSIAIYGDSIYATTADAQLIRLNASTGELLWESSTDNYNFTTHTTGPIIVKGMVVSGRNCSAALIGGCYILAQDAEDGRELWRFYMIPRPGEPGYETWGDMPFEKRRHVGAWHTGAYDPDTVLIYWGTSVPAPSPEVLRGSGDGHLLYSNSTVALDADTGKLAWYFQHLPRDNWDLDHPYERLLVDIEVEPDPASAWVINPNVPFGERRKVLTGIPGKTGIVWTLDRTTGEFLWARPTVFQNVIAAIDPETGAVTVNEDVIPESLEDEYATVCPSAGGGKNWPASSYSPRTQAIYAPLQNTCMDPIITTDDPQPEDLYAISFNLKVTPGVDTVGRLEAVSARTAKTLWARDEPAGTMSTLATAGDLVFVGYSNRRFRAHDAETGNVLWETTLNSPVSGFPISYETGGEQYVAVAAGGGDLLSGTWNRYAGLQVRSGSNSLYVFRLSATASAPATATAAARRSRDFRLAPAPDVERIAQDSPAADRDPLPDTATCVSYAASQAARGRAIYEERCAECHGATLRGGNHGSPLSGRFFEMRWNDRRASALHATLRETMPPGAEGSLGSRATSRLLAYILQTAGMEPGDRALDAKIDALVELRICLER